MKLAILGFLLAAALTGGAGSLAPLPVTATPEPLLTTREGSALRVGPVGSTRFVGLLANGEGAIAVTVAADGAFLAFTCAMAARAEAWFSGDWYRGVLADDEEVAVAGPDGERLTLSGAADHLVGTLSLSGRDPLPVAAQAAAPEDGLFRRDDADGVLGAVALPGNTVCAVKRTSDDRFLPAGTVPY